MENTDDMYYKIICNFYKRFRNKNQTCIIPKKENIQIKKIYLRNTVFSKENENTVKKMLVIHFQNYEYESREIIRLNVSYNDYVDTLSV